MILWIILYLSLNKSHNRAMCSSVDETGSCCLLIMLGDGCKVLGDECFVSVLIWCYHRRYFRHHFRRRRRRTYRPVARQKRTDVFKRMVELLSFKEEVSGTFPFPCAVNSLAVFLPFAQLSPPAHPAVPAATCIYAVGLSPIELNVLFILVLRR